MLSRCDHAGVFKPNTKKFNHSVSKKVNIDTALSLFNEDKERIMVTSKKNWWIIDFFSFQYGRVFNINNKLHLSIYSIYNQENIDLRTNRGLQEVKWWSWSGLIVDFDTLKEKVISITNTDNVKQNANGKENQPFVNFKAQGEMLYANRLAGTGNSANDT